MASTSLGDDSSFSSTPSQSARTDLRQTGTSPQEAALQSLCKQILKSRLFRGFYEERRYVESLQGYRDIVALQRSERDLEKVLRDIKEKLQLFYEHEGRRVWIGITGGTLSGSPAQPGALETYIWTELDELAFGEYWFMIRSVRFRENEIVLRLKKVRLVEFDNPDKWQRTSTNVVRCSIDQSTAAPEEHTIHPYSKAADPQISWQDFVDIFQYWGTSIKQTIYEFMAQDISKDNIKSLLQFLGLFLFTVLSGAVVAVRFLGVFTIRFIFELSRLTHVLTPIVLKMIDVFSKIIGGFYILLAMIWKDVFVNRNRPKPPEDYRSIAYNRPLYRSIEYNVRQRNQEAFPSSRHAEFERKSQ